MRSISIAIVVVIVVGAFVIATSARPGAAQPAQPPTDDRLEAAVALYSAGDFANAAILFESLYNDTKLANALFGWAQSLRQDNRCPKALELYRQYLTETNPQPHQIEATNEAIALCPSEPVETVKTVKPPPDEIRSDSVDNSSESSGGLTPSGSQRDANDRDWVSLGLLGTSSAAAATSLTFYILARSANSDADAADSHSQFLASAESAESRQRWSQIAGGVAVVGVAGLLAWKFLRPSSKSDENGLMIGPNLRNPGVMVQTRF